MIINLQSFSDASMIACSTASKGPNSVLRFDRVDSKKPMFLKGWASPVSSSLPDSWELHLSSSLPSSLKGRNSPALQGKRGHSLIVKCGKEDFTEGNKESPSAVLRRILASPGLHQGPACHDALSAKLVENAGFSLTFMSGFAVSAVRLALPDTGLISYGEMVDQGRLITSAVSIPVIGDADNGYGNALNVKRTVIGYIQAGFAGILLEDQVSPKACGHTKGRCVVSREDAVMRIKAAVDARKESLSDIVIVGRTDARQAISLGEALWRAQAFADAGADVLFIDALSSKEEMLTFCHVAQGIPKLANMLEGGGKTPILTPLELEDIGYKLVSYPLSLVGVSISAMQDALRALKSGRMPPPADLPTFEEIKKTVGFDKYYEEERRYITGSLVDAAESANAADGSLPSEKGFPSLENDLYQSNRAGPQSELQSYEVIPYVGEESETNNSTSSSGIWSRTLRVKITANTGVVRLDVRIPAGFLDGLAKIIPEVAGLNLSVLLNESAFKLKGNLESGQELLDINDSRGDRIQIILE